MSRAWYRLADMKKPPARALRPTSVAGIVLLVVAILLISPGGPVASGRDPSPMDSETATKEHPFENSLGMKFVPVPGTKVLFSIWDTRVEDYRAYAESKSGVDGGWKKPGFKQGGDEPVVNVCWNDAKAFCAWLTKKDRQEGKIGQDQEYRLPTDEEWSMAVGETKYPWGNDWPPPQGAGNYNPSIKVDDYANTSPVGSFGANQYGLYDMGGNVWQWCEDWYRSDMNEEALLDVFPFLKDDEGGEKYRVARGSGWGDGDPVRVWSSDRNRGAPDYRDNPYGFRCVLATKDSHTPGADNNKRDTTSNANPNQTTAAGNPAMVFNSSGCVKTANLDWDGAIADFNRAIQLDPKLASAYDNRGFAKAAKRDWDGAIADYDRAIGLDPKLAHAYLDRAFARKAKGDSQGANADYKRTAELDSIFAHAGETPAQYYNNSGCAKDALSDWDGAIVDCNRAIELDPHLATAYDYRGFAKAAKHDWDGAISDYNRAIGLDQKLPHAYANRGFAKAIKLDWDGAIADDDHAIRLDPTMAFVYHNRGDAKKAKGDLKGADADYKRAAELDAHYAAPENVKATPGS